MIAAPATARGPERGGFAEVELVSEASSRASEKIPAIDTIKAGPRARLRLGA